MDLLYHWVETNDEIEFEDNKKREFELLYGFPPSSLSSRRDSKLKNIFESDQEKILIREMWLFTIYFAKTMIPILESIKQQIKQNIITGTLHSWNMSLSCVNTEGGNALCRDSFPNGWTSHTKSVTSAEQTYMPNLVMHDTLFLQHCFWFFPQTWPAFFVHWPSHSFNEGVQNF